MFDFFRKRKAAPPGEAQGKSADGYATWVFWPNGVREPSVVNASKLEERGLASASNLLTGLSINGSIVRASVATGRIQTLTSAVPSSGGSPTAVRISGEGDQRLTIVAVFGQRHDATSVDAALKLVAEEAGIPLRDLETIVAECPTENGVLIANFGPAEDPAVDEAYGIALYLGAAMNGSATIAPPAPAASEPEAVSGIPVGEITLEQLALLNQRSAFILCGFAQGSRPQAQEWDDWLEQYRLPGYEDGMKLLVEAGGENVVVVNLLMNNAIWGEFQTMPNRFVSVYGTTSAYAIPWDGQNVPEIAEFSPPDPSQGARQAAVASLVGKLERLTP